MTFSKPDTLLSIVIVAAAVALSVAIVHQRLANSHSNARTVQVGDELARSLPLDFSKAPQSLLLTIESSCHYCNASIPFYRSLIAERDRRGMKLQIIVLAQATDSGVEEQLASTAFEPDAIVRFQEDELDLLGVPTLLIAGPDGRVTHMWIGLLSTELAQAVEQALFGAFGSL